MLELVDFAHFGAALSANVMGEMSMLATPRVLRLVVAGDADGCLTSLCHSRGLGRIGGISDSHRGCRSTGSAVLDIDQWGGDTLSVAMGGAGTIRAYAMQTADTLMQAFRPVARRRAMRRTILRPRDLEGGRGRIPDRRLRRGRIGNAYRIDPDHLVTSGISAAPKRSGFMTPTALDGEVGGRVFSCLRGRRRGTASGLSGRSPGDGAFCPVGSACPPGIT